MIKAMREAYCYAWTYSDDNSTTCGAFLCEDDLHPLVFGANRYSPGISINSINDRDTKLTYIEHAEREVIYNAARGGINTNGLTMVCPWACCCDCARAIVRSGVKKVIAHAQAYRRTPERWRESIEQGLHILRCGGVEYEAVDIKIGYCQNLFDGRVWNP